MLDDDASGGVDAGEPWHPDVHHDDVGVLLARQGNGLDAVAGLPDNGHVRLRVEDEGQTLT